MKFKPTQKRPAARAQGKQTHRCACCHETGHRIDTCTHPSAAKIRELTAELHKLKKTKPLNKVLRKEFKTKKSEKQTKHYAPVASEAYMKKPAARKPSPAELCRLRPAPDDLNAPADEQEAVRWLLDHSWARKPRQCASCGKNRFSESIFPKKDVPHWRCRHCGTRYGVVQTTIFRGFGLCCKSL